MFTTITEIAGAPSSSRIFRDLLGRKLEKNPHYSMRAFARDLGVSPAFVSLIIRGKRHLSLERAVQVSQLLRMNDDDSRTFMDSVAGEMLSRKMSNARLSKTVLQKMRAATTYSAVTLGVDKFKALSNWYHVAILEMSTCKGFKPRPEWVARQLGISPVMVLEAVDRLKRLGLLDVSRNGWRKTSRRITVPTKQSHAVIRDFHGQMIQKASEALSESRAAEFARRNISGVTLAVNPERVVIARKRIDCFLRKITAFLTEGDCREVYQVNVQLFPLTKAGKHRRRRS